MSIRLKVVARCDTDSTMRHFAYAIMAQDPDGDYVTWTEYDALRAALAHMEAERDAALAQVAAAYEAAAQRAGQPSDAQRDFGVKPAMVIRALTPADAKAALQGMIDKAVAEALSAPAPDGGFPQENKGKMVLTKAPSGRSSTGSVGDAEPVAWAEIYDGRFATVSLTQSPHHTIPLYAHPSDAESLLAEVARHRHDLKMWQATAKDRLHRAEKAEAERDAALARVNELEGQCCMCGKKGISTAEDGGPECQLSDGRWTCSRDCYERATLTLPPDADLDALAAALRSGEQADMDGTMVRVSRQACEDAADAITALRARPVGEVQVKPLGFEGGNGFWRADDGIGGFFEVTEVGGAFHMCRIVHGHANKLIPYESYDAATDAARVEHSRRIRAALEGGEG